MNKLELEKCIYKCFTRKQGSALSIIELPGYFQIVSQESMKDYADEVNEILNELVDNKYLNWTKMPNGGGFFCEGLNFEQWVAKLNPKTSNGSFNIETLNADNVQVGSQNTMNIGVTAEQFANALAAFSGKPEPERKSIMDKVLATVGAGAGVASAIAAFIALA